MKLGRLLLLVLGGIIAFAADRALSDDALSVSLRRTPPWGMPGQFGDLIIVEDKTIRSVIFGDLGPGFASERKPLSDQQMLEIEKLIATWGKSWMVALKRDNCMYELFAGKRYYKAHWIIPSSIWAIMRWLVDHNPGPGLDTDFCK